MAGGYFNDSYCQGKHFKFNENNNELPLEYNIEFWNCCDIFVYFSHSFITIPPVSWINNAHTNNSLVLGTIITEGGTGDSYLTRITSW